MKLYGESNTNVTIRPAQTSQRTTKHKHQRHAQYKEQERRLPRHTVKTRQLK